MMYLWEAVIQAEREGIPKEKLLFCFPEVFSAYMEVSNACLNQDCFGKNRIVEINPYYRFYNIFYGLYDPDYQQGEQLRASLADLVMHELAAYDVMMGMTRDEYYKELLLADILEGKYGLLAARAIALFGIDEQQIILGGMLRQYYTGCSMDLFLEMMGALMPDHIVYHNNRKASEILIYIGRKKNRQLEQKIQFLIEAFLDLAGTATIYYEHHFGIIGVKETMILGQIALRRREGRQDVSL